LADEEELLVAGFYDEGSERARSFATVVDEAGERRNRRHCGDRLDKIPGGGLVNRTPGPVDDGGLQLWRRARRRGRWRQRRW
jgi:hypothetical protein